MPRRPKHPLNAPVAKPTTLPTINEIPLPTYELLTQSDFFESLRNYVTCVLKLRTQGEHLVCMPGNYKGPKIILTDIVGAHATRLLEHEKSRKPGKLRKRFCGGAGLGGGGRAEISQAQGLAGTIPEGFPCRGVRLETCGGFIPDECGRIAILFKLKW